MDNDIIAAAEAKLQRIIDREGDADGIRRTPEYLYQLIAEETAQRELIKRTKKEGSPRFKTGNDHNQPLTVYHVSTQMSI